MHYHEGERTDNKTDTYNLGGKKPLCINMVYR